MLDLSEYETDDLWEEYISQENNWTEIDFFNNLW